MVTAIVLWIVAFIFILITLKNILVRDIKTRRCTEAVTGTVVEVKEKMRTQGRSQDHIGITTMEYIPTVSYTIDGVEYTKRFTKAYRANAYTIGQRIEIMVNPNKPSEINKKGTSNRADIIILCIGVLIGVAGVVLLIIK